VARALPQLTGREVFANADTSLAYVDVYGFDYDYTLATYTGAVQEHIYDQALGFLVEAKGYPGEVRELRYDPAFAVRGLHFDSRTGFLLKVDQFNLIAPDCVVHGRRRVELGEVLEAYNGLRLSEGYETRYLHHFADLFSLAEVCLLADLVQFFSDARTRFHAEYLYHDVRSAVNHVHSAGRLHGAIMEDPARFLRPAEGLAELLERLRGAGKRLFLLTNSPFRFVDAGMRYLLRDYLSDGSKPSWRELFDVVVVNAMKPAFFTHSHSPRLFRKIDEVRGALSLEAVGELRRGQVYSEGGLAEFARLTRFEGARVLYMGDQVYADLVEPMKLSSWKTAAVIGELAHEIDQQNQRDYRDKLALSLQIDALVRLGQTVHDPRVLEIVETLRVERKHVRALLKQKLNPFFGSVFRTSSARTAFFYKVARYADVYTADIANFLQYGLDHCFYVDRHYFPHELPLPGEETLALVYPIVAASPLRAP
jgi:HAD superfamily 5'-nucleotidase-like hydrolase